MGEIKAIDLYPPLTQVFVDCKADDNIGHGQIGALTYPLGHLQEVIEADPQNALYFTHDQLYAFAHEQNFIEIDRSRKIMTAISQDDRMCEEDRSIALGQLESYDLVARDIKYAAVLLEHHQFNTHNNEVKSRDPG